MTTFASAAAATPSTATSIPRPAGVGTRNHVTLTFPLARPHAHSSPVPATNNVHEIARVLAAAPNVFPWPSPPTPAHDSIEITAAAGDVAVDDLVEIGNGPDPVQRSPSTDSCAR